MTQISLDLPDEWLFLLDGMAQDHVFGAKTRQDVIRAILAEAMKTVKNKGKEQA
jgi:metal-responsive CopG/Arc/MetJ family transcriptional regulator